MLSLLPEDLVSDILKQQAKQQAERYEVSFSWAFLHCMRKNYFVGCIPEVVVREYHKFNSPYGIFEFADFLRKHMTSRQIQELFLSSNIKIEINHAFDVTIYKNINMVCEIKVHFPTEGNIKKSLPKHRLYNDMGVQVWG